MSEHDIALKCTQQVNELEARLQAIQADLQEYYDRQTERFFREDKEAHQALDVAHALYKTAHETENACNSLRHILKTYYPERYPKEQPPKSGKVE